MHELKSKVHQHKKEIVIGLLKLKAEGKTIVGYGAPAKATTMLHYFGIGADIFDYIVDDSPMKVGHYMPGNHIPILASEEIYKTNPDVVFIFAWNFYSPIITKLKDNGYKGQCIVPFI